MTWALPIAGALIGGAISSDSQRSASNKAADAQAAAADKADLASQRAAEVALYQYNTTRADNAPWRAAGENALNMLNSRLTSGDLLKAPDAGDVRNDPGYQFALSEGQRGIANNAAARGGIGGAQIRAGARFNQGLANQFWGAAYDRARNQQSDVFNRLSGLAGTGQQTNAANAAAGQVYANAVANNAANIGANAIGLGNVQAANAINQGNIYSNQVNQLLGFANKNNWWMQPAPAYGQPGPSIYTDPSSYYAQNGSDIGWTP